MQHMVIKLREKERERERESERDREKERDEGERENEKKNITGKTLKTRSRRFQNDIVIIADELRCLEIGLMHRPQKISA